MPVAIADGRSMVGGTTPASRTPVSNHYILSAAGMPGDNKLYLVSRISPAGQSALAIKNPGAGEYRNRNACLGGRTVRMTLKAPIIGMWPTRSAFKDRGVRGCDDYADEKTGQTPEETAEGRLRGRLRAAAGAFPLPPRRQRQSERSPEGRAQLRHRRQGNPRPAGQAQGRPKISTQEAALRHLREKALKGDHRALERLLALAGRYNDEAPPEVAGDVSAEDAAILKRYEERLLANALSVGNDGRPQPEVHAGRRHFQPRLQRRWRPTKR